MPYMSRNKPWCVYIISPKKTPNTRDVVFFFLKKEGLLTLIFSGKLIHQCISACYVFVTDVPSKFVGPANKYDISSSTSSSVAHKYLQVALAADENVAAKHGNHTADFLLVLANIVSNVLKL